MTIRLWLLIADCWKCGISVELTEEQQREAQQLLERRRTDSPHHAQAEAGRESSPAPVPLSEPARPQPLAEPLEPPVARPVALPHWPSSQRSGDFAPRRSPRWFNPLRDMPAWLVSFLFHLLLLILLGVLKLGGKPNGPFITLSTTVSRLVQEGGDRVRIDPRNEFAYDLPVPVDVNLNDDAQREALVRADKDAQRIRLDADVRDPHLADLEQIRQAIRQRSGEPDMLVARDPRIRVEMVRREGGTTLTEAAVARGLEWLAQHQNRDGNWSLHAFNRASGCTCSGRGVVSDSAATSLALLPFLGAGQTHLVGHYRETVAQGLRWLLEEQESDGDLRGDSSGNTGMYAHGQGALVLCEAFLMTGDEAFRGPAQRAIDFIVDAQHPAGGWRYTPGQAGDTSVLGWQLMALESARGADLHVPPETFELAGHYLDTVESAGGARYAYQRGRSPSPAMTAEALLCRVYLGWDLQTPGLLEGAQLLVSQHPPERRRTNIYYWYYATQTLHHCGGQPWEIWNQRVREILVNTQRKRGHAAGSWDPQGPHAGAGGRVYMTALAVCCLEVYYRHLPIFRQVELEP
jgi:hypothetical protein